MMNNVLLRQNTSLAAYPQPTPQQQHAATNPYQGVSMLQAGSTQNMASSKDLQIIYFSQWQHLHCNLHFTEKIHVCKWLSLLICCDDLLTISTY